MTVKLFGTPVVEREKALLSQLYNDYSIRGDGRTSFFITGWYKLEANLGLAEAADPCMQLFTGVDCNEDGQVSHLHVRPHRL